MNEQPPLERLADLVFEWATESGIEENAAEDLADSVQDMGRDALRSAKEDS